MSSDPGTARNRSLLVRFLVLALILIVAVLIGWRLLRPSDALPVYHPGQLDPRLVDPHVKGQEGEHRLAVGLPRDHQQPVGHEGREPVDRLLEQRPATAGEVVEELRRGRA